MTGSGYPWFYRKELLERYGFPWSSDVWKIYASYSGTSHIVREIDYLTGYSGKYRTKPAFG
ncbi:hypothetical protein, partial [Agathobacter rectalis]|uniref:hypothetical protein n=1 Tax=Agathobacter rectalis TaxID=39491 RepID=UPI0027D2F7E8